MGRLRDAWNKGIVNGEIQRRIEPAIDRLPVSARAKAALKFATENQVRRATDIGHEKSKVVIGATGSGRCANNHRMKSRDKFCERCGEAAIPAGLVMCKDGHRARKGRKVKHCQKCGKPVDLRDPSKPGFPVIE